MNWTHIVHTTRSHIWKPLEEYIVWKTVFSSIVLLVTQPLQYSALVSTNSEIQMVQDGIYFGKFRRSMVNSYTLTVTVMHETADWFKLIHRNNEAKVAQTEFIEKYDHSVGFCIIPNSTKSFITTYISSLVTGFQSHILKWNGMRLLAHTFSSA